MDSSFLRNRHTDFQSGCTSLHPHQQWMSISLISHPLQHKQSLVFLILVILTGIRWYLRVVLICLSWWLRMLNISLSDFWSFEILLLRFLCLVLNPIFKLGYLEFWFLISWVIYIFWRSVPFQMWGLMKLFSHSVVCLYIVLTLFLALLSFSVSGGSIY